MGHKNMYWSLKSKYLLVDKTGLDEPKVDKTHYKNTWVTFINYSFRLSQLHISVTKECHQIGFYWKGFFFIYISLRRPICLYTFLAFLPQTMQPRNSGHADVCKIKATTHLTRNADYKFSENFQQKREAPQLHFIQIVSILWSLHVMHTKGMQLR